MVMSTSPGFSRTVIGCWYLCGNRERKRRADASTVAFRVACAGLPGSGVCQRGHPPSAQDGLGLFRLSFVVARSLLPLRPARGQLVPVILVALSILPPDRILPLGVGYTARTPVLKVGVHSVANLGRSHDEEPWEAGFRQLSGRN